MTSEPPSYAPQVHPPQAYPPQAYPPQAYPPQAYQPLAYPPGSAYPAPQYPVAPPTSAGRLAGPKLIVALALAVLVVFGGGGWALATFVIGSGGGAPALVNDGPAANFTGDLRTLLLSGPRGAHPASRTIGTDGNLSLDQLAATYDNPQRASADLAGNHFSRAAVRQWTTSAFDTQIVLIQFASKDDATAWLRHEESFSIGLHGVQPHGQVGAIPGSSLLVSTETDDVGYLSSIALAVKGTIFMAVSTYQGNHLDEVISSTTDLGQRQFDALP